MANILNRVVDVLVRLGETGGSDALVGDALVGHVEIRKKKRWVNLVWFELEGKKKCVDVELGYLLCDIKSRM
jgi:hypothetical protein